MIPGADSTPLATVYGDEPRDCVRGLAAAPDGALYATTRHGIFRITPDGSTIELDLPTEPWRLGVACRGPLRADIVSAEAELEGLALGTGAIDAVEAVIGRACALRAASTDE